MKIKSITAVMVCAVSASLANAQIAKGTKYIGGMLGFNSSTSTADQNNAGGKMDQKTTTWNFTPEVGYFVAPNLSVGIGLGFGGSTMTDNSPSNGLYKSLENKGSSTMITLYSRKFFNVSESFHLFAGLDINYGSSNTDYTRVLNANGNSSTDNTKVSSMGANINGGMLFSLSERWSLVGKWAPGLGFSNSTSTTKYAGVSDKREVKTSNFGLNVNTLGTPFNVGLYYSF